MSRLLSSRKPSRCSTKMAMVRPPALWEDLASCQLPHPPPLLSLFFEQGMRWAGVSAPPRRQLSAHAPPLHTTVVASSVTAAPASADAGGAGLELSSHTPPLHTTVAASAVADAVDTVPPGMNKEFTEDELSYYV